MVSGESAVLAALRTAAAHPAALGFRDDAAVLPFPLGDDLVATHDLMVEGVHYTPDCPPADVAWKLLAVNLSDLAAMGARPVGVLLGLTLARGEAHALALLDGLLRACGHFGAPLLGGDTVRGPAVLSLTALGRVEPGRALTRAGARAGDAVWVSGSIGDAALGLAIASGEAPADAFLLKRYRRPTPRLALGRALAGHATACLDVSDGLLLDADRLAVASGVALAIDLAALPLSRPALARLAAGDAGALAAATGGDDYELLFTAPADAPVAALAAEARTAATRIGRVEAGAGLRLHGHEGPAPLPERLGYLHS